MRIIGIAGAALALTIAGWFLLQPSESVDDSESRSPQSGLATGAAEASDPSAGARTVVTPIASSRFDPVVEEPVTTEEASRIEAAPSRGRLLKVIDKETKQPIPSALVMFGSQEMFGNQENMGRYFAESKGIVDLIFRHGRQFRTDDMGQVRIPMSGAQSVDVLVAARKGKLFGIVDRRKLGNSQWIVELSEGKSIKVRVRDEHQRPAPQVQVGLRYLFGPEELNMGMDIIKASTDSNGLAVLSHVELAETIIPGLKNRWVGLVVPFAKQVNQKVNIDAIPKAPIELVLPPTKSVTVQVRCPDGSPPPIGLTVSLSSLSDQENPMGVRGSLPILGEITAQTDKNGDARFPRVGILKTWIASAWHHDIPVASTTTHAEAQNSPTPDVINLIWNPKFPTYVGTLLDPGGEPLTSALVALSFDHQPGTNAILRTDDKGMLRYPAKPSAAGERKVQLTVKRVNPPLNATFTLPPRSEGTFELGEIKTSVPRLIASGRVLKPDGTPCPEALLILKSGISDPYAGTPEDYAQASNLHDWSPAAQSDSDGSFTVYRDQNGDHKLSLHATHDHFAQSKAQIIRPGATELVLKLGPVGSLTAIAKVPKSNLSEARFEFHLQHSSSDNEFSPRTPALNYQDGILRVRWEALPLGRYELRVSHAQINDRVSRGEILSSKPAAPLSVIIKDITIADGDNHDPRLQAIDLNRLFKVMTFEVFSESNEHIADALAEVQGSGYHYHSDDNGRDGLVEVIIPKHGATVRAAATGFTSSEVPIGVQKQRIILSRATTLILTVSDLPEGALSASAGFKDSQGHRKRISLKRTDTPGVFMSKASIIDPGSYEVRIAWMNPAAPNSSERPTWKSHEIKNRVTIPKLGGTHELTLSAKP